MLEAVASGAAGSWSLSNLGPRHHPRRLRAGFYVEHFLKDIAIAMEEAGRMNLDLPGLALASGCTRNSAARATPVGHAGADPGVGEDERSGVEGEG